MRRQVYQSLETVYLIIVCISICLFMNIFFSFLFCWINDWCTRKPHSYHSHSQQHSTNQLNTFAYFNFVYFSSVFTCIFVAVCFRSHSIYSNSKYSNRIYCTSRDVQFFFLFCLVDVFFIFCSHHTNHFQNHSCVGKWRPKIIIVRFEWYMLWALGHNETLI